MHINIEMDKVHANHALEVILVSARQGRILLLFGSADDASWHLPVIVVSKRISSDGLGYEPAWSMRLLSLHDE